MSSREEMLGKIIVRLMTVASKCEPEELGIILDLLDKLDSDFSKHDWCSHLRISPWLTGLKKFARKEPCWESELPFRKEEKLFLKVVRVVLLGVSPWNAHRLVASMQILGERLDMITAKRFLQILCDLKVIRTISHDNRDGYSQHQVIMALEQFEKSFHVVVPE